jgi:precorrin-2 dehydrogenase/sirohydrochlorin ferrochelatase
MLSRHLSVNLGVTDSSCVTRKESFDLSPDYYPALLNLSNKKCVVVGGGKVAERKVASLVRCGAHVLVISPELTTALKKYKATGTIRHQSREYRRGDLKGSFLVIAATSDDRINREVSREAKILVNVADVPELANFVLPAVMRRGPLMIAVSTGGASPAMAAAIRMELELLYAREFESYLLFLGRLRKNIIKTVRDKKARERFFKEIASSKVLKVLRTGGFQKARKNVLDRLKKMKTGDKNI